MIIVAFITGFLAGLATFWTLLWLTFHEMGRDDE